MAAMTGNRVMLGPGQRRAARSAKIARRLDLLENILRAVIALEVIVLILLTVIE